MSLCRQPAKDALAMLFEPAAGSSVPDADARESFIV